MQKLYKYLANNSVKSFQYSSRSSLIRMMATLSWYVGLHVWELIYVQSTNVLILPSPIYRWRNWGLERFMIFFKVTWPVSQNLNSSQSNFRDDPLSTTLTASPVLTHSDNSHSQPLSYQCKSICHSVHSGFSFI